MGTSSIAGRASGSIPCSWSAAAILPVEQIVERAIDDRAVPYVFSKILRGTLPGRKPGIFALRTSLRNAASCAASYSSGVMLISSSTCVGSSVCASMARVRRDLRKRRRRACGPPSSIRNWSGRRDLNSRPSPWQGDALPLSYFRGPRTFRGAQREPSECTDPSLKAKPVTTEQNWANHPGARTEGRTHGFGPRPKPYGHAETRTRMGRPTGT